MREIVLVGGGHSHLGVLQRLIKRPIPGARLTLISNELRTPYSGMLPGFVAGHYSQDEMHVDLQPLARRAGAQLLCAEVIGIDRQTKTVLCAHRPPIAYDLLSINIGSVPQIARSDEQAGSASASASSLAVKPIHHFNARWLALLDRLQQHSGEYTIAMVGAGAAGVEMLLAMAYRLRRDLSIRLPGAARLRFHLFSASATVLPSYPPPIQAKFMQILRERGIQIHLNTPVTQLNAHQLRTPSGHSFNADDIFWATPAAGAPWLRKTGLALDEQGFILVKSTLQSLSDPAIFAAGDTASLMQHPPPKAGVFAVRMSQPLANNLRRATQGKPLIAYHPQQRWLSLLTHGDQRATASYGLISVTGRWVWRWKNAIDQGFLRQFRHDDSMT